MGLYPIAYVPLYGHITCVLRICWCFVFCSPVNLWSPLASSPIYILLFPSQKSPMYIYIKIYTIIITNSISHSIASLRKQFMVGDIEPIVISWQFRLEGSEPTANCGITCVLCHFVCLSLGLSWSNLTNTANTDRAIVNHQSDNDCLLENGTFFLLFEVLTTCWQPNQTN